jgi:hypothetical protein
MGSVPLSAQFSFQITWDSLNVPTPSVVNVNDTFRYNFTLNNLTNSPFNDSLYFHLRTNLGTFRIAEFDSLPIAALGSRNFSILESASAQRYGGGVNVVVVWPTSPAQITTDSLIDTLTVIVTSIDPAFEQGLPIEVFPIPSQQEIFFRLRDNKVVIRRSEIINLSGLVIRSYDSLPRSMSVEDLAAGIYFIRIEDDLGRTAHLKMVKQ